MQRKLSSRPTFKPQLESLETRDLPSGAGIVLFLQSGALQQTVQAMQTHADQAQSTFIKLGADIKNGASDKVVSSDYMKLGGEIQAVKALNTQLEAQLSNFNQAVFMVAANGDEGDRGFALFSYFQVNGGLGGLLGGSSSGGVQSQAHSFFDQVDQIAKADKAPDGTKLVYTIEELLNH